MVATHLRLVFSSISLPSIRSLSRRRLSEGGRGGPVLGEGGVLQSIFAVCNGERASPIFHQNSFGESAYSFKFLVLCSLRAKI
jgi:hypothetical protein